MAISINSNPVASAAALNLQYNNTQLELSLSRLSSGSKLINSSADPGGLAVSMKLAASINRQTAAITNVQNAMSFVQLQDGDLKSAASIVDRMAALRSMYDDVTKSTIDQDNYNTEFQSLRVQLYETAGSQFNGVSLFSALSWHSGNVATGNVIEVLTSERGSTGSKVSLAKITLLSAVNVKGQDVSNYKVAVHDDDTSLAVAAKKAGVNTALGDFSVDSFIVALQNVATLRAENGATASRMQFALSQLQNSKVNLEAANSRIVDTDIAHESTRFARYSILTQANAAMLSQANNAQSKMIQMLML
jgi:flagellin